MNLVQFDRFCKGLIGTKMVVQWGESHVWKIGDKMFALGNSEAGAPAFVFKTSPLTFEILLGQGTATRPPYLPRGNWVHVQEDALPEQDLAGYIRQSYGIVSAGLPKAVQRNLRLI